MQLQQALPDLKTRGLGLAAISYDSPAILKAFAEQKGITFPLLSDRESATITRFNILNTEATGRTAGIPYPGTFVVDRRGVVISRAFEEKYQERATAGNVTVQLPGQRQPGYGAQRSETAHLTVTTSASDRAAAPGTRLSLLLDVAQKPKMHVYAPDQKELIPISLSLKPDDAFSSHAPVFPAAETYFFAPLKETQRVYSKPFRIVQDVTIALTPAMRERARSADATITISGALRYQACDDKLCYLPQQVPVSWVIGLRAMER